MADYCARLRVFTLFPPVLLAAFDALVFSACSNAGGVDASCLTAGVTLLQYGGIFFDLSIFPDDVMFRPTYKNLHRCRTDNAVGVTYANGSPTPQGNPRLWKYYWQVFSAECPWEDEEFFQLAALLCTADFENEVERLLSLGQNCMVYGIRRPRADPANPWDMSSQRWKDVEFAVSYDKDTDPIVMGGFK
jgi:hypothetical protein